MKIQIAQLTEQDKKERKLPKVNITFGGFKNMKIQINDQQPLDEVVRELERLGYKKEYMTENSPQSVKTLDCGVFHIFQIPIYYYESFWSETTTLAELKEM